MILVATISGGLDKPRRVDGLHQLWFRCSRPVLNIVDGRPVMESEQREFPARDIAAIKSENAGTHPEWEGWSNPIPVSKTLWAPKP